MSCCNEIGFVKAIRDAKNILTIKLMDLLKTIEKANPLIPFYTIEPSISNY